MTGVYKATLKEYRSTWYLWHTAIGVTGVTDVTDVTEGGNLVFWIPFLVGAATAASLGLQIYSAWEGYNARNKTIEYTHKSNAEVERFWADYYRNTGYRPLYPYRSGAVVNDGYIDSLYAANWQAASALTGGVFNHSNKVKNIYNHR